MRRFDKNLSLTEGELRDISRRTEKLVPLAKDIGVRFEIVKRQDTTARFGEHCLLMYSERKPFYLLNAGYMLEQMDLFLPSLDIGACWLGMAKAKGNRPEGMDYVIMLAFGRSRPQDFRSGVSEFKRKKKEEIWQGDFDNDVTEAVRLAPSACNTQPWRIASGDGLIKVYRSTRIISFIPPSELPFFNSIDLGICLCFLETAMAKKGHLFERNLIGEEKPDAGLLRIAEYVLK